jgi:hypothetical protein
MRTTGHRTTVHGATQAAQEWRRILDLSWRHGLAALPATRPEFAIAAGPSRTEPADDGARDVAALRARQALESADAGVLYIEGAQQPEADDVLLVDANGAPQFSCSSWSNLAQAARRGQLAVLEIAHHAPHSPAVRVAFAGALSTVRRDEIDREWFESVALTVDSVSIDWSDGAGPPRRQMLSGGCYRRYSAGADGAGIDDPAS